MVRMLIVAGIGKFRQAFDGVIIYSDVDLAELERALPIEELKALGHKFDLERISYKGGTRIKLTCRPDKQPLKLLKRYEQHLGTYRVVNVEIAADDFDCGNAVAQAKAKRDDLLKIMNKRNFRRGYLIAADRDKKGNRPTPERQKRRGLIPNDFTVYFEDDGADVGLKVYLRQEKLVGGQFGDVGCHVEFTLSRSRTVRIHLGGDQLDDLINANLAAFIKSHLRLEEINYERLGQLISPRIVTRPMRVGGSHSTSRIAQQWNDEGYRARRVAGLAIKIFEERNQQASGSLPEDIWRSSPAQIKGRLRDHLKKQAGKRTGARIKKRNTLTMKKLEACFTKISFLGRPRWVASCPLVGAILEHRQELATNTFKKHSFRHG